MKPINKKSKEKRSIRDYGSLYQSLQVEAIYNAITNSPAFFERKVRRWFSKNFNTPLKDTFNISWDEILINYYEAALEDKRHNEIFDIAIENYLPEFISQQEQADREFAESLVEEQRRTLEAKRQRDKAKGRGKGKKPKEPQIRKPEQAPSEEIMNLKFEDEDFEGDGE